ncbi:MAG: hypothetical protein Kow0076_1270 [Francisella sp.]
MKKVALIFFLTLLWINSFASYTFSQSFFDSYDNSTENKFSYKNNSYRDDAKIKKYKKDFSTDNSNNYKCSINTSGKIQCGNYKILNSEKHKDISDKVTAHFKQIKDLKDISKGDDFNCALDDKNDIYCWGSNKRGQLGSETKKQEIKKPLRVDIDSSINFKKVYTKAHYACALDENGYAYCWGDGSSGEVGNGEKGYFAKPQKVKTNVKFSRLSMATTYTCGIAKNTNEIYCWGKSKKGNSTFDTAVPVKI